MDTVGLCSLKLHAYILSLNNSIRIKLNNIQQSILWHYTIMKSKSTEQTHQILIVSIPLPRFQTSGSLKLQIQEGSDMYHFLML